MTRLNDLVTLLREVGYDPDSPELRRLVVEMDELWTQAEGDPRAAVRRFLAERRASEGTRQANQEMMKAVAALEEILEALLEGRPLLCRFESARFNAEGEFTVVARLGSQLRELGVHPEVDVQRLRSLLPWHYVCVHPQELVVTGYRDDPELFHRAHGELVEFLGWADRPRGLVRVSSHGNEERIAELAPTLRGTELQPPTRLVLQRDDDRWAIAAQPSERRESRFEVDAATISTRLDKLAGLDEIKELLIEDFALRFLRPELAARHGIKPLRGVILSSHQPGQGKTAFVRAFVAWASEAGRVHDIEVVLYFVPPGALKTVWHGGDAKLVREDLCGAIRARRVAPRTRPLFQVIVLDEIDALGSRVSAVTSPAQNDALTALLSEMDGIVEWQSPSGQPPAEMLWIGMTNRIDLVDVAVTRPGRFDSVIRIPPASREAAEDILAIHATNSVWYVDGEIHEELDADIVRAAVIRPALRDVFDATILRYATESRAGNTVTAGRLMSGAHYEAAANEAKKRASSRDLKRVGVPAVSVEDLTDTLWEGAFAAARQMSGDPRVLARELGVAGVINRVEILGDSEPRRHRYLEAS